MMFPFQQKGLFLGKALAFHSDTSACVSPLNLRPIEARPRLFFSFLLPVRLSEKLMALVCFDIILSRPAEAL